MQVQHPSLGTKRGQAPQLMHSKKKKALAMHLSTQAAAITQSYIAPTAAVVERCTSEKLRL